MSTNDQDQSQSNFLAAQNINLHELQPELIAAKELLQKVLDRVCMDDRLMEKIYQHSGDSTTVIIWYWQQTIKYLEAIIANNQVLLEALAGKFNMNEPL